MGDAKWTFERIQAEVEKVAYNTPPYKGNKAVTAFQAEQLMGLVRNDMQATIDALRAQLATAQKWRTRWKAMAHRKRQHHRNALAALGLNITYVRELQQEVKRLDEQVDGLQAQLATAQQELAKANDELEALRIVANSRGSLIEGMEETIDELQEALKRLGICTQCDGEKRVEAVWEMPKQDGTYRMVACGRCKGTGKEPEVENNGTPRDLSIN